MSNEADIARLYQRTPPADIPPEYDREPDGHEPVESPAPHPTGFCRIDAKGALPGEYVVTEILWNGTAWEDVPAGQGLHEATAWDEEGYPYGEVDDQPIAFSYARRTASTVTPRLMVRTYRYASAEVWTAMDTIGTGLANLVDFECDARGGMRRLKETLTGWHENPFGITH